MFWSVFDSKFYILVILCIGYQNYSTRNFDSDLYDCHCYYYIVRLLLGGVPVSIRDGFKLNESTLHWACNFSNIEVAKLLLVSGVEVNNVNLEGQTSLHLACESNNIEMIQLLLSEGADTKMKDIRGKIPKDVITKQSNEIIKLLDFPTSEPSLLLRTAYLSKLLVKEKDVQAIFNDTKAMMNGNHDIVDEDGDSNINDGNRNSNLTTSDSLNGRNEKEEDKDIEQENYEDEEKEEDEEGEKDPLLVIWPPVQRQSRSKILPLILSSTTPVLIHIACDDPNAFPILKRSGLLDVLDRFNLTAQVKLASAVSTRDISGKEFQSFLL